jgi:hypothetical protein
MVREWLRSEGLAVLAGSLWLYGHSGLSWWLFAALLLLPDVAMLPYLISPRWGAIAYNVAHSYLLPLGLALLAPAWIPYLCIWTAHIGMDRMMGYGLKYPTAFRDTHLGTL